jgi:TonB family protein
MNHLLIYLLESSLCLGGFYFFYTIVLRNQPSHQYNRFFLLATSLLSFILPLLEIPLMVDGGIGQVAGNYQNYILLDPAVLGAEVSGAAASSQDGWHWGYALVILYAAGVLVSLGIVFEQVFQLLTVVRQSSVVPKDGYRLVYTKGKLPSSSFFSYLFWDNTQQLSEKEAGQIIAHEEAHIREGHSYDVLYMALLKVVFWFHPLIYLYEHALTDVHEFTADARAIQQNPGSYARLLTRSLFAGIQPSLVNHFYKSRTLKRIKMMHLTQKQTPRYKHFLALPLLAAVFFTFSCQTEEELEKEAIAATYDDVQDQRLASNQAIHTYIDKYFGDLDTYDKALGEKGVELRKNNIDVVYPSLQLTLFREIATTSDYEKIESLLRKELSLTEKLKKLPDADGIFTVVDNQPAPEGGIKEFYQHIVKNLKYPAQARKAGIEGKVFIQFVVNEYGELTEFKSLKGIGHGCDEEAIRVLQNAEAWNPGTTNGKPVKVRMVLPITFKLDDGRAEEKPVTEGLSKADNPESNLEEIVAVGYTK